MDVLGRALVAAAVLGAVWLLARWWAGRGRSSAVDVSGLMSGAGVVIFTRDDCINCEQALAEIELVGVATRRVRLEEEPELAAAAGVEGVPMTVVVDGAGRSRAQFGGKLDRRRLRRALRRAGIAPAP